MSERGIDENVSHGNFHLNMLKFIFQKFDSLKDVKNSNSGFGEGGNWLFERSYKKSP